MEYGLREHWVLGYRAELNHGQDVIVPNVFTLFPLFVSAVSHESASFINRIQLSAGKSMHGPPTSRLGASPEIDCMPVLLM